MSVAEWFFTQQGQQKGPVSQVQLQQMAQAGQLQPSDMLWKDGMANWAPANSVPGLFGGNVAAAPSAPALPSRQGGHAARPQRGPARGDSWDDSQAPRGPARKQGINPALLWGLIGGGVALVAVIVVIVLLVGGGSSGNERSFSLGVGRAVDYKVQFEKGKLVTVTVKSEGNSDVNLYVFDSNKRRIVFDRFDDSHPKVSFIPTKAQRYTIQVVNTKRIDRPARNGRNSGTVKWVVSDLQVAKENKEKKVEKKDGFGPGPGPIAPGVAKVPPFTIRDVLRPGPKLNNRGYYKVYAVSLQANRFYTFNMFSKFDNYLYLQDPQNRMVKSDDDGGQGLNAQIIYRPMQTGTYRIYATTFGSKVIGPFTLSATVR